MKYLYSFFVILVSGTIAGFLLISSIHFSDGNATEVVKTEEKSWYEMSISVKGGEDILEQKKITQSGSVKKSNAIIYTEFNRLTSFLYLAGTGGTSSNVLTASGKTDIILGNVKGIISLYDLFSSYRVFSSAGEFRLDQITNGSFYIGKEGDGKIAIYAIDGVARLNFLSQGEVMTSMVLFPGSYIRFDPSKYQNIKGADLFRIITSLQEEENEVFEFVNPRVNLGESEDDTFFNYRLPVETKGLFRVLSLQFKARVESVKNMKAYARNFSYDTNENISGLVNPTKINHNMLLELSGILSKAVEPNADKVVIVPRIKAIYDNAKTLNMEASTAKQTIEQFLLDGRFAVFGGVAGPKYQEIYDAIAQMIGIEATTGKTRLLQNLADIYSRNLFTQKKTSNLGSIDTYVPTASELRKTLEEGMIDQKDYFDIAIYAFNILKKMEDRSYLSIDTLREGATYDYLVTFLSASEKYIHTITDSDVQSKTITSFSVQFYDQLLTNFTHSLYSHFAQTDGNSIFLSKLLVDGSNVNISDGFVENIKTLDAVLDNVLPTMIGSTSVDAQGDSYVRIKKAALRIHAFAEMLNTGNYRNYVQLPYQVDTQDGDNLPKVTDDLSGIMKIQPTGTLSTSLNPPPVSPILTMARTLFPNADNTSFIPEGEYLRVVNAPVAVNRGDRQYVLLMSVLLDLKGNVSDINFVYNDRKVQYAVDRMSLADFTTVLQSSLGQYIESTESHFSETSPNDLIRIFPNIKRINIGDATFDL